MKESMRKCFKCGLTAAHPDVVLYRFPRPGVRNTLRCELWAKFMFPHGQWNSQEFQKKLFTEHRMLCHKHFELTSFSNFLQKKLFRDASPKENCVEDSAVKQPVDASAPGPSQVVLSDITNSKINSDCSSSTEVMKNVGKENHPILAAPISSRSTLLSSGISRKRPAESKLPEPLEKLQKKGDEFPASSTTSLIGSSIKMALTNETVPSETTAKSNEKVMKNVGKENHPILAAPISSRSTLLSSGISRKRPAESKLPEPLEKRQKKGDELPASSTTSLIGSSIKMALTNKTVPSETTAKSNEKDKTSLNIKSKKEEKYYLKSRKYFKRICQLRNAIKKYKAKDTLHILSDDETVKKLQKSLSPSFSLLLQGQMKNVAKKPRGRRWTTDDKILALRIYKRGPTCYRLLRRMFYLPAPSSLKKLLSFFDMPPGINKNILTPLKNLARGQKPSDNEYILMFDEMAIKKHLRYNKKGDIIEGYQDHGEHGRTPQEAVKALVFMISGIRKAVKQRLAHYLSSANVTADRLSVLIKQILCECFNAGLQVSATVCDMGGTNRRALALLGATEQHPVIKINNKDIVTLFDAPHLLKCFRNMFMKYDIKCNTSISSSGMSGEGIAKWNDIKTFYEMDQQNSNFVFAPSLTKAHLEPNTKEKMKVNLAAQVLSHTVAAGIFAKVSEGKMPATAAVTADVLSNMDKLFDLVNSTTRDCRNGKPYATNISKTSPHLQYFRKMKFFFKNITFIGCPRRPPSLEGWVWTMNGIELLWNKFQKYKDVHSLATRRLQQDPLENLFGCIRGNCGSNANPTTSAFIGGMKTAIMSNMAHISSGNCEKDENVSMIDNFKTVMSNSHPHTSTSASSPLSPLFESSIDLSTIETTADEDSGELQACAYVCGFLMKNLKSLNNCTECKKIFQSKEVTQIHIFTENKEYFEMKKCLNYSSRQFVDAVEHCATLVNKMLVEDPSKNNLKKTITSNIDSKLFDFLTSCPEHFEENVNHIKSCVFYICVNRFCTLNNRKYNEEASKAALKKKVSILKNL